MYGASTVHLLFYYHFSLILTNIIKMINIFNLFKGLYIVIDKDNSLSISDIGSILLQDD